MQQTGLIYILGHLVNPTIQLTMYLSNLKLWNFRKFGAEGEINFQSPNLDLQFSNGLNVIIGENDSGKTAIIDAIKLVLKTHSYDFVRVDEKDFFKQSERFRIELIFEDLSSQEAKNFTEWLGWVGTGLKAKPFLKLIYDVSRNEKKILSADVKAGLDDEGYLLTAEAREYLRVTYLKPLRDAENELIAKRNSRLSQILLGDVVFKEDGHPLVGIFQELSAKLSSYFKGELEIQIENELKRPTEGKAIKDKIDQYVKGFHKDEDETEFHASSHDIKSILEKLSLFLKGDSNPGLGTLNRLFMAAELLHLNKADWTGLRLGLVEELEAHLHPQIQMQVIEAFQKQERIQLILTTHSPNLASKLKLDNLIVCTSGGAFPMGHSYTKLKEENYKFLEKFLDTTKANLFFAKGIILVEGWAEEILIPSIAKAISVDLTKKGVSIVNIGNTGFEHYANIYLRRDEPQMKIPVAIVTDVDVREYEKIDGNYQKRTTSTVERETNDKLALISGKADQTVSYFPAPKWTLEYSLLKSNGLRSIFVSIVKSVHPQMQIDDSLEKEIATKLINKGLHKTEIAYRLAHAIDEDLLKRENERTIKIDPTDESDTINYLIKAIRYAAGH